MPGFDKQRFRAVLKKRGLNSVLALARVTGLHRNTINYYLSGHSVYQQGYRQFCQTLGVEAHDLVCPRLRPELPEDLARILDQLAQHYPELVFVLFGSRARFTPKEHSDWDIGFFSHTKMSHDDHLGLLVFADKITQNTLLSLDLINLNEANTDFLADNRDDFIYLMGSLSQWNQFVTRLKDAR